MFFHADGAGGWTRLETRLKLNGLKLKGAKVPTNPSDVPGAVADHAEVCVSEGALHLVVPQASIPFKTLIKRLEEKGILKPSAASKKLAKDPEPALTAAFHSEVYLKPSITFYSLSTFTRLGKSFPKRNHLPLRRNLLSHPLATLLTWTKSRSTLTPHLTIPTTLPLLRLESLHPLLSMLLLTPRLVKIGSLLRSLLTMWSTCVSWNFRMHLWKTP